MAKNRNRKRNRSSKGSGGRRRQGAGSSSTTVNAHPKWRRTITITDEFAALTSHDLKVQRLLVQDQFTENFKSVVIHSIKVSTQNIPANSKDFPGLTLDPGWVNGDSHPSIELRSTARSAQGRAVAFYKYPNFMREPWGPQWTFCTISSNCTKLTITVDATLM